MRIAFLISDDFVWSPKVLHSFLADARDETVAIAAVMPNCPRKNVFKFILIYLNLLYPALFLLRSMQSISGRIRAAFFRSAASVRNVANAHGIPYKKVSDINAAETRSWLVSHRPDVLISIQTQYIRPELRQSAPLGVVNVHPSKLPAYRGPAPIFWILYNREQETAVTAHFVNDKLDDGPIIAQEWIGIASNESYYSLGERITAAMPGLLRKAMETVRAGGPYRSNVFFEGCYQTYPNMLDAFRFHTRWLSGTLGKFIDKTRQPA